LGKYDHSRRFLSHEEQDGLECLLQCLSAIHEDINEVRGQKTIRRVEEKGKDDEWLAEATWKLYEKYRFRSPFTNNQTVQGLIRTEYYCITCNQRVNVLFDEFTVLKVSIPLLHANTNVNIEKCLKEYVKKRNLEDDIRHCEKCDENVKISENKSIYYAPEYLILAVERFNTNTRQKNNTSVCPNLLLDLKDFCASTSPHHSKPLKYELYAMLCHLGDNAQHGHYISKVNNQSSQWIECNDSDVQFIDSSNVSKDGRGYVFFYQKTTV